MKQDLSKLYEHIDDIEIAMMTTRREDGHLQSPAMATQKRAEGADLSFVTNEGTAKLHDPHPPREHNSAPADAAVSTGSQFLYTRNGGNATISAFSVNGDGSLTSLSTLGGLPGGANGIAAR